MLPRPRNFSRVGVGSGNPEGFLVRTCPWAHTGATACACAHTRSFPSKILLSFEPVFPSFGHLQGCLAVMTGLTKALKISPVGEDDPVSPMWLDVVHHGGTGAAAPPGALPAERLIQELRGPKVIRPRLGLIHPVPLGALPPLCLLGFVLRAVTLPGQVRAARLAARPERLQGHGLSPPGKTKSRHRRFPTGEVIGTGSESTGPVQYPPSSLSGSPGNTR